MSLMIESAAHIRPDSIQNKDVAIIMNQVMTCQLYERPAALVAKTLQIGLWSNGGA